MKTLAAVAFTSVVLASACGDASPPGSVHDWPTSELDNTEPTLTYGWDRAITASNFDPAAANKQGSASNTLAGETLRAVVTDANVRVRGDDKACTECHAWAPTIERDAFCNQVDAFMAQPISKGDGTDPPNAKPEILRSLFSKWKAASCP